jgi:methyl-accepting chemotaxis protein
MKGIRFTDIPLVFKVGFPPAFALAMLAALVACASWSQHQQAQVLATIIRMDALQSELSSDSARITAANGALYILMTKQAAGGSVAQSQADLANVLQQIDDVRADLQTLKPRLAPSQRMAFDGVLKDLTDYRGGIQVVSSMLRIDFGTAAGFIQPFEAIYQRMTATLDTASQQVVLASRQQAAQSTRAANLVSLAMILFAGATLVLVAAVAWFIIVTVRHTVRDISQATESLAKGQNDLDLARLERRDEFGAIVRSLNVFRDDQRHMAKMRTEQSALEARELASRQEQERQREEGRLQQQTVVTNLAGALESLAQGDLSHAISDIFPEGYEKLRLDFNAAIERLADAMAGISTAVNAMHNGTNEISEASGDLSRRTEEQAARLEETAAAIDEISDNVRKTAAAAQQVAGIIKTTKSRADTSSEVADRALVAMEEINRSSSEIGKIVGIIDGLAFQTNLLALNAGIEAARAGDAGRGFAVVATEVRALAQRSADSAKQIKVLINASTQSVGQGVDLVSKMSIGLTEILAGVTETSVLISEIAVSAEEQATGLSTVNTAVDTIDKVTQQNAAVAEQSAAASRHLADEAHGLQNLVSRFQLKPAQRGPAVARAAPAESRGAPALKVVTQDGWAEF